MKKTIRFSALIMILFMLMGCFGLIACNETTSPSTPPGGEQEGGEQTQELDLNFMTFNIRTETTSDTGNTNWSKRKVAVFDFINNCNADVIGLQEVKQTQFNNIVTNLASKYDAIFYARQSGGNPEGLAIIYNKTIFNLISSDKYWLSQTPETQSYGWGESYYRIATETLLQHKETGEYIKTVNTHGPLNDTARLNAYNLVMERSVNDDYFTFLCGDFNAYPNTDAYNAVAEELQDCRVAAEESTTRGYNTFNGWGKNSDPTIGNSIIDFCFVSKGENIKVSNYVVHIEKWGDDNENYYSDHYAVETAVKLSCDINLSVENTFVFEGEDTTFVGGKPAFKETQTGASNGYAIGGLDLYTFTITLTFNADNSTTARLFIQGCSGATSHYNVAVSGRTLTVNNSHIEKTGEFQGLGWGIYDEWYVATINLIAGENTIIIKQTTSLYFMNVDYFKFVTSATLSKI